MEFLRRLARGRSEETPVRALGAVFVVVFTVVALVVTAAILIYLLA
jgi:hypothetical protein